MTENPSFLTWFIQDVFKNEKTGSFSMVFGYANIWDFECIKGTRIISAVILETFKIVGVILIVNISLNRIS